MINSNYNDYDPDGKEVIFPRNSTNISLKKLETKRGIESKGLLPVLTINNLMKQREEFLKRQQNEIERVWGKNFNPFPAMDKIANRIALSQVREASNLLESTCESFVDSIVHSEFHPSE